MNEQIIQTFSSLLAKLAAVLVTLSAIISSPVAAPAQGHHFGGAIPNVAATTTVAAMNQANQTVPYVSSLDITGGVYTLSTTTASYNGTNLTVAGPVGLGSGGTVLTKIVCATTSLALTSNLAVNATATFDISLTGATSSVNQAFFGGAASSSANTLQVTVSPSSSTGIAEVLLNSKGGTWNGTATTTYSACYAQF